MAFATPDDSAENTMESHSPNGNFEDDSNLNPEDQSNGTSGVMISGFETGNKDDILKKRKLDDLGQDSETSQDMSPLKKSHLDKEVKELFPDLEKFWSTVEQDPNDFTAWTHLLQYVDQVSDKSVAGEAYDAFLEKYPYCYGYWKKYADYTRRRGSDFEVQQIFSRGLQAIPLSVDLWIHFVTYVKSTFEEDHDLIRAKFDEGIDTCGLEFRSDKLWELYVQWETEIKNLQNAMQVWDQMISTPTQSLRKHFDKLLDFVNEHEPSDILQEYEYSSLLDEFGSEETSEQDLTTKLRDRIIRRRTEMFEGAMEEVKIRAAFEEGIKRPYFHVKPVEKNQLKNWTDYLEFEIGKGNLKRITTLFERCLIACAMYAEYWDKYLQFLQSQDTPDIGKIEEVFTRTTRIHHPKVYKFGLDFAAFEEGQGNLERASTIYEELILSLDSSCLPVYYRHINFERRRNDLNKCVELFEKYIRESQNKTLTVQMTIKYARFLNKIQGSYAKAVELLKSKLESDEESSPKFLMALVELGMNASPVDFELVLYAFDYGIQKFEKEEKLTFARRKLEFLEDYTNDVKVLKNAEEEIQAILKVVKPEEKSESAVPNTTKPQDVPNAATAVDNHPSGYNYGEGPGPRYPPQYGHGQYPQQGQYGPPWNSHSQAPPPASDPGVYGQSYVNPPTAWNSFYA